MKKTISVAAVIALLEVASAFAQCPSLPPGPAGLGTVSWGQASSCGAATCQTFTVSCSAPDAPAGDATGEIRITEPTGAPVGTLLFLTGGRSQAFYGDSVESGGFGGLLGAADEALADLRAIDGYRTVEIKFDAQDTWSTSDAGNVDGVLNLACRPATLFDDIYNTVHGGGAGGSFCGTGNSGGGATLAYSLSHYGLESIFDGVLFTSGPPMSHVDRGCLGHSPGNWDYACVNRVQIDQSFGVLTNQTPMPNFDCTIQPPPPGAHCIQETQACAAAFQAASIISTGADYTFPGTHLQFLFGANDGTSAVDQGRVYCDELELANSLTLKCDVADEVPGASHALPSSINGAAQVRDLLNDC